MTAIQMPCEWNPRAHQLPPLQALDSGCKRVLLLWHRRAGKDACTINWCATEMARRATSVLYLLPEFKQAKRVLFREIDPVTGKTMVNQAIPEALRVQTNETEGFIRLWNGSIFQVGGFDTIDSYVGAGPRVVVFSEYAVSQHGKRAWNLVLPILLANGGVAIFPFTPRGKNHGQELYEAAERDPSWFTSRLTVDDTGLVPWAEIQREIDAGTMDEDFARQEFRVSFEAPNSGSYYGRVLEQLESKGQITDVPHDPSLPVFTWWDIGYGDSTAIWFVQAHRGGRLSIIDYYENEGQGLEHYLGVLNGKRDEGWVFEPRGQLVPHDFDSGTFQTGQTATQIARKHGWRMTVVPRTQNVGEDIDAVRRTLPRCWFDKNKRKMVGGGVSGVGHGLDRLKAYRKKWSEQLQVFTGPLHDINSNGADAFRTGVNGMYLAGMHIAPSVEVAAKTERLTWQTFNGKPSVATTDFNVWSA